MATRFLAADFRRDWPEDPEEGEAPSEEELKSTRPSCGLDLDYEQEELQTEGSSDESDDDDYAWEPSWSPCYAQELEQRQLAEAMLLSRAAHRAQFEQEDFASLLSTSPLSRPPSVGGASSSWEFPEHLAARAESGTAAGSCQWSSASQESAGANGPHRGLRWGAAPLRHAVHPAEAGWEQWHRRHLDISDDDGSEPEDVPTPPGLGTPESELSEPEDPDLSEGEPEDCVAAPR